MKIITLIIGLCILSSCLSGEKEMESQMYSKEKKSIDSVLLSHDIKVSHSLKDRSGDIHNDEVNYENGEVNYEQEIKEEARKYYKMKLSDSDFRNFDVTINGYVNKIIGKSRNCYNITVKYDIYKYGEWKETHYKNWYWDMNDKKCFWYSDISIKGKVGMMTSVIYVDVTEDAFSMSVMKILEDNLKMKYGTLSNTSFSLLSFQ